MNNKLTTLVGIIILIILITACAKNENDTKDKTSSKLFIAVGAQGTLLTSSDGESWTAQTSGTSNNLRAVAYGNSTLVTVGSSGTILTSSDGTSWTSRTSGTSNV